MKYKRGADSFDGALQSLGTALTNITAVPSADQDHYTFSEIYLLQGDIYASTEWPGTDKPKALENYRKAKEALNLIPNKRSTLETKIKNVETKIAGLQPPASH